MTIKRGTCILTESPFVYVLKSKYRMERCDQCLDAGKVLKCARCQYVYYCNQSCQKEAWKMHSTECIHLKNISPKVVPDAARIIMRIILKLKNGGELVKGYYTEKNYRKWDDLMSHTEEIKCDQKRMEHFESLYGVLLDLLGNELVPSKTELLNIYGRLVTNGFNILDPEMNSIGTGIYLGVSVTDHSCKPNAIATFEGTTLKMYITEDIPCLDWSKIFISYVDILNTANDRRNDLHSNYYFLCTCSKCIDSQEQIEMTAAKCLNKNCNEFLDIDKDKCPKCHTQITKLHRKTYKDVMEFTKNRLQEMSEIAFLDVCQICLNKQKGILHPLNVLHVKTLDSAFESAVNIEKWATALEFSLELIAGFRKYYGNWNPLLGLLYMKIGKIQLYEGFVKEASRNLNEARKIIEVTHGTDHILYKEQLIPLLIQATSI